MQHSASATDLMTMREYARSRHLNVSTISRQVARGVIPAHAGRIDPHEADLARERNLDVRKRRQRTADAPVCHVPALAVQGMMWFCERLRDPERIDALTSMPAGSKNLLITPEQARLMARAVVAIMATWLEDIITHVLGADEWKRFDEDNAAWIATWTQGKRGREAK